MCPSEGTAMRLRSLLALCAATATAVSVLGVPAGAQETSPKAGATKAGPSDIREIPSDRQYRLAPGLQRPCGRRPERPDSRSALAAGETPPVGTDRQWLALDDFNGRLYRKEYTLRGVGDKIEVWVASDSDATSTGTAFPAGDCRNDTPGQHRRHRRPGRRPGAASSTPTCSRRSRTAFSVAPDRDGSSTARPDRTGRRRLLRRRRQDRHAGRQRPGRQLLRLPGGPDLHRRLLLLAVQRPGRPQRHDDRRVRLAAPHRCRPGRRADRRPVQQPPRAGPACTRASSPTSTSTCCSTTPTRPRSTSSTRGCPTSRSRWSATATPRRRWTRRAPRATSTASRASARSRRRSTRTHATAAARRTR